MENVTTPTPTRRQVVKVSAAATMGIATVAGLAGCGSSSSGSGSGAGSQNSSTAAAANGVLATVSAVPVGGAIAAKGSDGKPIVIAQPESGKVVAFSAICTHAGCQVAPTGKTLNCPCHGSSFDAFTGAVLKGPATSPLPAVSIKVDGGNVLAG